MVLTIFKLCMRKYIVTELFENYRGNGYIFKYSIRVMINSTHLSRESTTIDTTVALCFCSINY